MKAEKLIKLGLEVVELEMSENTQKEVFEIENKIWELTK